jgi:hypothetical protein
VQWSDCGIKRGDTASLVALGLELPSATNLFQERTSASQSSLTSATLGVNVSSIHPCHSSTASAAQALAPPWRSRMWHRLTQRSSHSRLSCEVAPHGVSPVASLCRLHYSSLPCPRATVLTMFACLARTDRGVPYHGWPLPARSFTGFARGHARECHGMRASHWDRDL